MIEKAPAPTVEEPWNAGARLAPPPGLELQESGAKSVTVVATHGVLSGPAVERLKNCGAREVVLTDTVPIPEEKRWDGLTVLSIAPLLASAIKAVLCTNASGPPPRRCAHCSATRMRPASGETTVTLSRLFAKRSRM